MSEATPPKRRRRRYVLAAGCLFPTLIVLALVGTVWYRLVRFRDGGPVDPSALGNFEGGEMNGKMVRWASPPYTYEGPGRLHVYAPTGCAQPPFHRDRETGEAIAGPTVECKPGLVSKTVPSPRLVVVHLPAGYDPQGPPLPLVIALHGFGQRSNHVLKPLLPAFDEAEASGQLPKVVLVIPDISLSGNGLDDPRTPWEDVGGSWGANSNVGRFADFLNRELIDWVAANYRVRTDPAGVVLLGASMGGTVVLTMMLNNPQRFPNVGAFYPGLDMRYSCDGDRVAPYRADCYRPIENDKPNRSLVTGGPQAYLFTERFMLFPVFDSDQWKGPVWQEDKPVWQRVREWNPVDLMRDRKPDLHGVHIWYVVGERDDFNIMSHVPTFDALAMQLGATLEPANRIRPGRHDVPFINDYLPEAVAWIGSRLTKP